jgi:hypothetical protein
VHSVRPRQPVRRHFSFPPQPCYVLFDVSVVDVDELFRILREHYQRGDGKVRVNTSGPVGPEDFRSCEKDVPISAFGEF